MKSTKNYRLKKIGSCAVKTQGFQEQKDEKTSLESTNLSATCPILAAK